MYLLTKNKDKYPQLYTFPAYDGTGSLERSMGVRWIAASIGCTGTLCLHLIWTAVFIISPSLRFIWTQLYISSFFLFGIVGAYWLKKHVWYMLFGAVLIPYISYMINETNISLLSYITALKNSILIAGSISFGCGIYMLLFHKIQ
jgi:hypothetical protein